MRGTCQSNSKPPVDLESLLDEAADRLVLGMTGDLERALADPAFRTVLVSINAEPLVAALRRVSVKLNSQRDVPLHVRSGRRVWL